MHLTMTKTVIWAYSWLTLKHYYRYFQHCKNLHSVSSSSSLLESYVTNSSICFWHLTTLYHNLPVETCVWNTRTHSTKFHLLFHVKWYIYFLPHPFLKTAIQHYLNTYPKTNHIPTAHHHLTLNDAGCTVTITVMALDSPWHGALIYNPPLYVLTTLMLYAR